MISSQVERFTSQTHMKDSSGILMLFSKTSSEMSHRKKKGGPDAALLITTCKNYNFKARKKEF